MKEPWAPREVCSSRSGLDSFQVKDAVIFHVDTCYSSDVRISREVSLEEERLVIPK